MSKEKEAKRKLELKEMKAGLKAKDDKMVIKTIQKIRKKGEASLLPNMLQLLASTENGKVHKEINNLLKDLHEESALQPIIDAMNDPKLASIRAVMLSTLWQSRLDASAHVANVTQIAVDGNFVEAMEAQTVVTNLEGPFEEEHLLEAMLIAQKYLQEDPQDDKRALIEDIMAFLKEIDAKI